ncbi:hypothetical protein SUNI508_04797 [Seiridium unicorne]|uniref:Uncharacterized protein n=1 Tax=Seiridium unicorne TaxID=138068 RepID=A0ABR2V7C8_9PEZI
MSAANPTKRPRVDSLQSSESALERVEPGALPAQQAPAHLARPPPPTPAEISAWIETLTAEEVKSLLHSAATNDSYIAGLIKHRVDEKSWLESNRVRSFDHYSKSAWHKLNRNYGGGSRDYDASFDVESSIDDMFCDMVSQTHVHSSYGTKFSCIETMRKIFRSVLLSPSQMADDVLRTNPSWDAHFLEALGKFHVGDMERLARDEGGAWVEKLKEVMESGGSCYFESLQTALDELLEIQGQGQVTDGEDGAGDAADDNFGGSEQA